MLDAHFHLWDPRSEAHAWLASLPPLNRCFGPEEYEAQVRPSGFRAGVLVQSLASAPETESLLKIAADREIVAGVVGWVDLERGDVAEQVEHLRSLRGGEHLVGIRHLVQDEPDPAWFERDAVGGGIEALARAGLVYDLLIKPAQLDAAIALVGRHERARFVLDHGAKPEIASGGFECWAEAISDLAALPNVACKLSGLVTEAGTGWTMAGIQPYVDHLLAHFGPQRLLFGSDWPACTLVASHADVAALARTMLAPQLDDEALDGVFRTNAIAQYGLRVRDE